MALQVNSVQDLRDYISGVARRAEHHAPQVREVLLTLAGAVIHYSDAESVIEVREHEGRPRNQLWFAVDGGRYVLSYDHERSSVVLKRGSQQGEIVAEFTNSTTSAEVVALFEHLRPTLDN